MLPLAAVRPKPLVAGVSTSRQYVVWSMPTPIIMNAVSVRQENVGTIILNEQTGV